ncbi:uncharacterized protein Bfra_010542 [Botrytis fragariae]|uniref:Uncharacterized protein n=1 Tax=Botrytis fragariae TaxID=1964551 RepID=A0A8H6AHL6_9HELO|nr:uncharacterized protein Bfra_010542 [Botrytis fragariae]KAF5867567.1 hypothetical protein Bfra_010542 [Botrytis fragariae]
MADIQPQSPDSGDDSGSDTGSPTPIEPTPTCSRCVIRLVLDPTERCVLHQPTQHALTMGADTKCTYCQAQRARCYKCPSALKPEILELQQRAQDYNTWVNGQSLLPPAQRSTWVLPTTVPAVSPSNAPDVYKELLRAHKVVAIGINRAQRGISGWKTMRNVTRNSIMRLDPVMDGYGHRMDAAGEASKDESLPVRGAGYEPEYELLVLINFVLGLLLLACISGHYLEPKR